MLGDGTLSVSSGTDIKYEAKGGKIVITITIDEKKIAATELPKLLAAFAASGEPPAKPAAKQGRPKKAPPGAPRPASQSDAEPLPFAGGPALPSPSAQGA